MDVLDGDIEHRLRTLGERLRSLRVERGHSLGEVSAATGLSTSFLSLVENGRSDISTGRLFRVARFLGVSLGDLLEMEAAQEVTVIRADERRALDLPTEGVTLFPLVNEHDGVRMAPALCEYEPGAHLHDVPGMEGVEHLLFMIEGAVEISMAGSPPLLLRRGDAAYLRASRGSGLRNVADGRSALLWVSSPPAFATVQEVLVGTPAKDAATGT